VAENKNKKLDQLHIISISVNYYKSSVRLQAHQVLVFVVRA